VLEVDFSQPRSERRRSERISESLPLIVRGIDLLGQPFEERTSTLVINLHGCRYSSKRHMPRNAWVTLGLLDGSELRATRARIAWVQRPQTPRDFFEVGVELESPRNIWRVDDPPASWSAEETSAPQKRAAEWQEAPAAQLETNELPVILGTIEANVTGDPVSDSPGFANEFEVSLEEGRAEQHPFLGDVTAELHLQRNQVVGNGAGEESRRASGAADDSGQTWASTAEDFFQRWKESLDQAQSEARGEFSAHLSAQQEAFLTRLKSQFEERFAQASSLLQDLDHHTRAARAVESDLAARAEEARQQQGRLETATASTGSTGASTEGWQERFHSELGVAEAQWRELLQSSLDNGIERLAMQLSQRSQAVVQHAEERMANRFAELRQPLAETTAEARDALNRLRSDLEHEMTRARSSLVEIEHVATRLKDYSGQLEASSHDTLNELHRRLENILEGHTREMNRHAESLVAGMSERLNPTFDSLGSQLVERTTAEVESRLAPYLERVPALIRDLSARELQAEEGLRLHRERLRQLSESSQREAAGLIAGNLDVLRDNFEAARKEAVAKWNEEVNMTAARASQSVSESIGQTSEWFQNEARARLQVVVEQVLATAKSKCDDINAESAQKFAEEAGNRAAVQLNEYRQQLETAGGEAASRARSTLDEAASAAAASFGQLLQSIAEGEAERFAAGSSDILRERTAQLERSAEEVFGNLTLSGEATLLGFRKQMASEVEVSVANGRNALASELDAIRERFAGERALAQQEWSQGLERLSEEAAGRHQERLQTACDTWLVSSVRRLNEHGQNVIESLTRSAEQALRDSCSKVFEGLAETMRSRTGSSQGFPGYAHASGRDASDVPPSQ
jgi:hypothetical protein